MHVEVVGASREAGPGARNGAAGAEAEPSARCPRRLRDSLLSLIEATPGLVMVSSQRGRILYMNAMGRDLLGVGAHENVVGRHIGEFHPPRAHRRYVDRVVPQCRRVGHWRGDSVLVDRNGAEIPVSQMVVEHRITETDGREATVFSSISWDLREHKRAEEQLRHQATHDPLTGLPNRALLCDRIAQALRSAQRHARSVAVLFVDFDDFKRINDTYGHESGDQMLRMLAERLKLRLRAVDTVARYGGDEFVVVAPGLARAQDYSRVLAQVRKAFEEPFGIARREHRLSASVGVAVYPDDGDDVGSLLRKADAAMYAFKRRRRPKAGDGAYGGTVIPFRES